MENDVDMFELANDKQLRNFTGADIEALLYNAQLEAVNEQLEQSKQHIANDTTTTTNEQDSEIILLNFDEQNKSLAEQTQFRDMV